MSLRNKKENVKREIQAIVAQDELNDCKAGDTVQAGDTGETDLDESSGAKSSSKLCALKSVLKISDDLSCVSVRFTVRSRGGGDQF